jgi:hypothetical protein
MRTGAQEFQELASVTASGSWPVELKGRSVDCDWVKQLRQCRRVRELQRDGLLVASAAGA